MSLLRILLLSFLLFCSSPVFAAETQPLFERKEIVMERAVGGPITFDVEIAKTPEQQNYGLMFRRDLLRGQGMLFVFSESKEVSFWMKNTYIPLDLLFIKPDGSIGKIVAQAEPQNVRPIPSDEPVRAVLEIAGGEAEALSLQAGDRISIDSFFELR